MFIIHKFISLSLHLSSCLDKQVYKLFGKVLWWFSLVDSLPSWEISCRFVGLSVHYQCSQASASLRQHIMLLTVSLYGNLSGGVTVSPGTVSVKRFNNSLLFLSQRWNIQEAIDFMSWECKGVLRNCYNGLCLHNSLLWTSCTGDFIGRSQWSNADLILVCISEESRTSKMLVTERWFYLKM